MYITAPMEMNKLPLDLPRYAAVADLATAGNLLLMRAEALTYPEPSPAHPIPICRQYDKERELVITEVALSDEKFDELPRAQPGHTYEVVMRNAA